MSFFNVDFIESTLYDLKKNESAEIIGFNNLDTKTKQRILELGFVPGANVGLENKSFLGDAILINLDGYLIALRKDIAQQIQIKRWKT